MNTGRDMKQPMYLSLRPGEQLMVDVREYDWLNVEARTTAKPSPNATKAGKVLSALIGVPIVIVAFLTLVYLAKALVEAIAA